MDAQVIRIPIRLDSLNKKTHWVTGYRKNKRVAFIIRAYLKKIPAEGILPCQVTLTRIAPRSLDLVNLYGCFKHPQDTIADYIIPGLAPGRADGDSRISWVFNQRKGNVREYALEITVEKLPC